MNWINLVHYSQCIRGLLSSATTMSLVELFIFGKIGVYENSLTTWSRHWFYCLFFLAKAILASILSYDCSRVCTWIITNSSLLTSYKRRKCCLWLTRMNELLFFLKFSGNYKIINHVLQSLSKISAVAPTRRQGCLRLWRDVCDEKWKWVRTRVGGLSLYQCSLMTRS